MTTPTAVFRDNPTPRPESADADVAITLMGGFAVTVGSVTVDQNEWRRRQAAALVKVLALARSRTLHREQLMDLLWPDLTLDEAAPRLHKAAHFARRTLDDPRSLVLAGELVALFPGRSVRVDAVEFEALANGAIAADDPAAARRAVEAYDGDLLPQDRYETWALDAQDRLHLLYLRVLRLSRRWDLLAAVDPADEEAQLAHITELKQLGDTRSAIRQFGRLERALRTELGVAPSPRALRLRDEIVHETRSPVRAGPIRPAGRRDGRFGQPAPDPGGRPAPLNGVDRSSTAALDGRSGHDLARTAPGGDEQELRAVAGLLRLTAARIGALLIADDGLDGRHNQNSSRSPIAATP